MSWLFDTGLNPVAVRRSHGLTGYPQLPSHLLQIVASPVYIEDLNADPVALLTPAFDVLWNAVGVAHTQTDFDAPA